MQNQAEIRPKSGQNQVTTMGPLGLGLGPRISKWGPICRSLANLLTYI